MLEPEIARKCGAGLLAVALLASVMVLISWLAAAPGPPAPVPAPAVSSTGQSKTAPLPAPALNGLPSAPPPATAAAAPQTPGDPLERKAFQLEMENARLRSRLDDMLNWILENVRGTFPLPEAQMANLRLKPVDENLAVSDDLAQLLRLNEEEIGRLDTAFSGTRAVLQDLETENISVDKPSETQVVLSIPPYQEEGALVREELYGELEKTLGPARFSRFLQVAEPGLEEQFEYFGRADRTLEFEALQDAATGAPQLFVRDERVVPSKDDPLRQDIIAVEQIVTELPEQYQPYWSWLPEYVTRFGRSN